DYPAVHRWALRFLGDKRLVAHGTLAADLQRVEEESSYAMADAVNGDAAKAGSLLGFVEAHSRGGLKDKAVFGAAAALCRGGGARLRGFVEWGSGGGVKGKGVWGAAAALSRAGRVDAALAARARLWKELPGSPLVPRALLASAADHAAVGDLGEAAGLLERYFAGYKREQEARKRRAARLSRPGTPVREPLYEEAKAQSSLHDAALLREARGELAKAIQDRKDALEKWPKAADRDEQAFALGLLRAKGGDPARAARELTDLARSDRANPALQIACWRESARLFALARQPANESEAWRKLEALWRSSAKGRAALPPEASAAAAEAHFALGAQAFEDFKRQRIEPPL